MKKFFGIGPGDADSAGPARRCLRDRDQPGVGGEDGGKRQPHQLINANKGFSSKN